MTYAPTPNMGLGTMPQNPSRPDLIFSDGMQGTEDALCRVLVKDCSAGGTINLTQAQTQGYGAYKLTGAPAGAFNLVLNTTTNIAKPHFAVWNTSGQSVTVKCGAGTLTVVIANGDLAECRMFDANRILPVGGTAAIGSTAYTVPFMRRDVTTITVSALVERFTAVVGWHLPATTDTPAGDVGGYVDGAPSAQTDFDVKKNGTSVATIRFAASAHSPTLICAAAVSFIKNDRKDIIAPASLNGMTGVIAWNLLGQR